MEVVGWVSLVRSMQLVWAEPVIAGVMVASVLARLGEDGLRSIRLSGLRLVPWRGPRGVRFEAVRVPAMVDTCGVSWTRGVVCEAGTTDAGTEIGLFASW